MDIVQWTLSFVLLWAFQCERTSTVNLNNKHGKKDKKENPTNAKTSAYFQFGVDGIKDACLYALNKIRKWAWVNKNTIYFQHSSKQ